MPKTRLEDDDKPYQMKRLERKMVAEYKNPNLRPESNPALKAMGRKHNETYGPNSGNPKPYNDLNPDNYPKTNIEVAKAIRDGNYKGKKYAGFAYASGGSTSGVPRPPKGEKYAAEANDWRAGEDEFEMAKEKAKKAKPVAPAPKPKAYAKGGTIRGGGIETKGKTKGRFV